MKAEEYEEYLRFFKVASKFMMSKAGLSTLSLSLDQGIAMLDGLAPAQRRAGLQNGVNDLMEDSLELKAADRQELEVLLKEGSCKPLSFFLSKHKRLIGRLKGKSPIKNEVEYYALKNFLDTEWQELSQGEVDHLSKKLSDFETKASRG